MGVSLALAAAGYNEDSVIMVLILGALGAVIPDLDVIYKHRKLLHNVFSLLLFSAFIFMAAVYLGASPTTARTYTLGFAAAWASHVFGDMLTRGGVRALWPFSNHRFRLLKLRYDDPLASILGYLIGAAGIAVWLVEGPLAPFLRGAFSHAP